MVNDNNRAETITSPINPACGPLVDPKEGPLPDRFGVYIECLDEAEQRQLLRDLTARGHRCRAVIA